MPESLAPDIAEQLLDLREPAGGQHAALTALLVAAAGPALPTELAGEDAALRGFRLAYRSRRRRRAGLLAGAAVAVLSLGGTAYAAGGDHLPGPVQRTVDSLFGERDGGATPSAPAAPLAATPGPAGPPTAAPPPPSPNGGSAAGIERLCRAWEAARADPRAPQVTGEDRRALAQAAKSATGIDDYCRGVLAGPATSTATATTTTTAPGKADTGKPGNGDKGGGTNRSHPAKPSHP